MASKNSFFGSFGAKPFGGKRYKTPKVGDLPAPRNLAFEENFCQAIRDRVLVKLRYEDDVAERTFAPHAVFHSLKNKVSVSGTQIKNPGKAGDEPRYFEIGKVASATLTDCKFTPHPWFNRSDEQYRNGIICSV